MTKITPKQKAKEIYERMIRFRESYYFDYEKELLIKARLSSLNLVYYILRETPLINNTDKDCSRRTYYIEVIQELKKIQLK